MIRSRTLGRLGRKLRSHRKKSFRKLIVETLEDRRVLATIGWDGGGDGQSWLDAANWEGNRLPGEDDDVVLNVADQEAEIFVYGSPPAVRSVSNHETLIVLGTPQLGTGRLTTGSLVNQGTLGLESTNNGASAVIDVQGGSVVNAAGATLDVLSHAGGSRQIIGALINDGEMRIEGSRALLLRGDQASFEQRGGRVINTVEGARGTVDLAGGELIWSGGTMSEHVHLLNSVINITSGVDQTVDLRARGTNTLVNNLAPNVTIFVEATGSYGSAKLIAAAGAENHGSIHMASSHSWYSTTLDASNTLVNSGSISFARSQTSTGYFVGTFDNSGLISIGANASGNFQGTYIGNGGSIEGNLFFHKSTIRLEQPAATPTRVRLYENNTLASNIPNNHVLEVAGTGSYGSAKLTFSQDVVNHGKIEMNTHHSWYSSHIDAGAFSFTNAADGEISVHRGQGNARTITAGLTNLGIFSVEANQTVWISGAHAALNMTGGRLSGAGTIAVDKGSIQWTGGDIDVDVAAKESVLDVGDVNDTATIRAWVSNSLIRNYGEDVTIHVEGTGAYGSSTLIAQTNAENRGTLRLASSHSWYSVTLDANNELLNTGTILVHRNQTSTGFLRGAFRNTGLIAIGSGAAGDFIGTYIGDGGSVTGNLFLRDSVVQLEKAHRDPTRLRLYKSNQLVTDNMPNTTLEVAGTGAYGSTTLTLGQSLSNRGTIELVTHHSWYSSTIEAGEFELTNTPDGSIVVKRGHGNARYLRGELINDGQVQIEPNQTWWINGPQSAIQMRDGRISGGGTLAIDAGQVQWTGGALDTTVATLNSTLDISSVTDAATIRAWKNNTLLKNSGESVIVHVEGTGTYGSATLTAAPNAENRGTIKLASSHSWYSVTIDATEPLLNSGTIDIVRNQTSTGILRGTIRNSGHIQVGSNAGGDFIGTYVGLGGSTSGNLYFRDSTLELESAPETTSHLRLYKSNTLASDIPANMLLEVAGTGSYGNTTLHVSQPVTNHGTVRLVSHHSWYSSTINPGDNLFTNAADGIIEVHAGSGNSRHWTGSLTNAGRIRLRWPLNLGSTGSSVINSGIIDSQSTLLLKSQDFQNLEGAFLGGGSLNLGSTTLVDQGTIDQGSPALVDATFDPAIVELKFNADMDAGDLNTAGNYQLWLAGPDAQWGTADDQNISDRIQSVTSDLEGRTAWLIISPILESSEARVVLDGSMLHSSGGTPLFGDSIIVNRPTEQLPPSLTFELPDDQDTGISANDGVTRLNSPEFVYRVNKPGVMSIDFENDGEVDAQFTVDLPGEFRWQAPQLPDANFPVLATFSDGNNEVIDSYALTIDTTAPELLPGNATQTAPFYGREFQFTEPVNSSLVNKDDLTLTGPAGPIAITGVTGSNTTYTFTTNIQIAAGTHRLAIPPAVSDLAGNTLALNNGEVVDQFELLPDLDPPELDDLSPVGLRGTGVESILVQFNEEMDASSFASADIQVLLPDGSQADPSQFTVQPTSTTRFTVQATGLDSAGHYQLTIGPGIKDLSGNEMEQPGRGEFTIDSIGPRIVNDSIPATIHDSFTRFELSTSEPVQLSSLRDAFSIVDPNGQNLSSVSVWQHAHNQYAVAFPSLRDQGNYEVRIANTVVDLLGNQLDQNNNQVNGEDQDVFSATFEVRLPELAFDGLPTLSSTSVALGESLQVQWNVENIGSHSTQGTWHDRVFLSKDGNISSDDWALGSVPVHAADVNATNGYQKTFDITIPLDRNLVPGDYQILVQTNAGDDLYESNPGNNSAFTTATLRLPPLPDLALDSVQLVGGNFLPGDKVNLSWTLSNIGSASAEPVWIERVFLSPSIAGNDAWLIHEHGAVEAIAAGAHATRTLDVTIPKIGPVGQWFAFVMIDAADEVFETNEVNPPKFTQASFTIEKKLTLESFRTRVSEDGEPIALLISRNGPTDEALEVALATAPGSQLEVPASVVIPANSASTTVYATPVDGDGVDGPATVNIQVSADGFVAAEVAVTVDDIDQAALVFEALPEMREGEIHSVTLRRTDDLQSSKEVTLRVQSPAQFELPESVSFSAGQSEVTFDLLVVDDPILEKETVTRIEATASDYVSAFANLTVVSSDIPNLTLLMPVGLSEEEGLKYLSVERGEPSPHPLQLQFRTDSPDQISFPRFATIPGGETSITFPIQVIDDDLTEPLTEVAIFVDGLDPRTGDVLSPPLASATTTIADNDQPALSLILDRTLVAEGGTIQGLVRRNEATQEPLTVQLESRDTGELTVPPMVTIAAGMRTAAFPIDGQKDGTVDGEQRVTILVSADGWATGQGAVVVSDSDLPDLVAVISEMDADVHTQQSVTLEWELRNQGVAPADAGRQRLFLRNEQTGDEILLDESQLTEDLLPGHGIRYRVPVELPQQVGQYRFVVRVDVLSQVREIIEYNNLSEADQILNVQEAYTVSVESDVDVAQAGTPITLTGQATDAISGEPVAMQSVHVHIRHGSTHRLLTALTDDQGQYAVTFRPLSGEAGAYHVGASHPGNSQYDIQDTFTLVGFRLNASRITVQVTATAVGTLRIQNQSEVDLNDLTVEILDFPDNLSVEATLDATSVAGNSSTGVQIRVTANDATYVPRIYPCPRWQRQCARSQLSGTCHHCAAA